MSKKPRFAGLFFLARLISGIGSPYRRRPIRMTWNEMPGDRLANKT